MPDPDEMNAEPQPWRILYFSSRRKLDKPTVRQMYVRKKNSQSARKFKFRFIISDQKKTKTSCSHLDWAAINNQPCQKVKAGLTRIKQRVTNTFFINPVAKFLVPEMGDVADSGIVGLPAYVAWRNRPRQPYAGVNFIPPVRD
jgi:hypothetical protein